MLLYRFKQYMSEDWHYIAAESMANASETARRIFGVEPELIENVSDCCYIDEVKE